MHPLRTSVLLSAALLAAASFPAPARAASTDVNVAIVTTAGTIQVALDPAHAPVTVKNFLRLVDKKFFNGGSFFRVVPSFMIQGGNKTRETPNDPKIPLESPLKTGIHNVDGAIAMARTPDPNSADSEFFICDGDQRRLDGAPGQPGYAAFGHVTKNMAVVRKIARMPATAEALNKPVTIVRIQRL
jgi:peptidyl-prolyl cis-trans isomerase A (cyclophilin A)